MSKSSAPQSIIIWRERKQHTPSQNLGHTKADICVTYKFLTHKSGHLCNPRVSSSLLLSLPFLKCIRTFFEHMEGTQKLVRAKTNQTRDSPPTYWKYKSNESVHFSKWARASYYRASSSLPFWVGMLMLEVFFLPPFLVHNPLMSMNETHVLCLE